MKIFRSDSVKMIVLLLILLPVIKMIDYLPWWSFVIPVLALGMTTALREWQIATFRIGFGCGFVVWFAGNWYFDMRSDGVLLLKIAALFSVAKPIVLLASGIIGGVLTGLALYAGKAIFFKRESSLTL